MLIIVFFASLFSLAFLLLLHRWQPWDHQCLPAAQVTCDFLFWPDLFLSGYSFIYAQAAELGYWSSHSSATIGGKSAS